MIYTVTIIFQELLSPADKIGGGFRNGVVRPSVRLSVRPVVRPELYLRSLMSNFLETLQK